MRRRKKCWKIILAISLVLGVLLVIASNFLVSAALVPSFMAKLDAFQEITEESVDALVQTEEIQRNQDSAIERTVQWLQSVKAQEVTMTTRDGYQQVGRVFYQAGNNHKWVLLLHGYTGWKEEMYPFASRYWEKGYQVVAPDMRCMGESEGDFIGMGYTESRDNLLWIDYILQQDPEAEIVIHGQSMGAACGLIMAGSGRLPENVRAVVSDCAYTDAYTMFQRQMKNWFHLPSFPLLNAADVMLRLRGGYSLHQASALEGVKNTELPLLIIHGTEDEMVPVSMAYDLYENAKGEKELLIVEGAGHAQAPEKDPETYYSRVFGFLEKYVD